MTNQTSFAETKSGRPVATSKTVLIIEDDTGIRLSIHREMEKRGFKVYSSGDEAEANLLADLHWEELDVLVLDMELEKSPPVGPRVTGADIAIKFRRRKSSFPPESLIYSEKEEVNYYKLALKLGAAAYLYKKECDESVVSLYAGVLALRRALHGDNPRVVNEITRLAVHSRTKADAIQTFCRRVLKPEFESCLGGVPFVILFTEDDTTLNCADNAGLPEGSSDFYHDLQAYAHGEGNPTRPFILETHKMDKLADPETAPLYQKLNRAAFLPVSLSNNLKLSIGLLHRNGRAEEKGPTEEEILCKALAEYLRPTVLENIMSIWSQWTELRATRNSTAKLCLSVGQEIKDSVEAIKDSVEAEDMEQLEDLANDLKDTGQYLTQLESRSWYERSSNISIREVATAAWDVVAQAAGPPALKLELQGDCDVHARSDDVIIIVSRLLQWFVYRGKAIPLDVEPIIKLKCEVTDGAVTVTFEDNSYRLPKKLREDLFMPFTQAISTPFADLGRPQRTRESGAAETAGTGQQNSGRYLPLYLAKMLVEGRYQGFLNDHSDEITEHSYGHRIVMQLPAAIKLD
jgi:DNA-binding NarL/FixJ family response regulator/gas vesicle protein